MAAASIVALLAFAVLPLLYLRDVGREKRQRGMLFHSCLDLFPRHRVTQQGRDYPVLTGIYAGHSVRLEPVLDTMAARKLPSLWLKVTLLRPNPERPVFSFLMRPDGNEFYSPNREMAHRCTIPPSWPQNALFCADQDEDDLETRLDAHMTLFADPRAKELVASPHGVRLVYQVAQAERAHYLVLRQARFENAVVDPAMVRRLLDGAIVIAASLDCRDDVIAARAA
jgi:hypothetical protein